MTQEKLPEPGDFAALFARTERTAVHLETRDAYTPDDPLFVRWLAGEVTPGDIAEHEREWGDLVRATVARGVVMRRARVVSEPLAPFIRFEYEGTGPLNVAAGEQVRWLPRTRASDLCLPGNDFWVLDDRLVQFHYFAGDGRWLFDELTEDPAVVKMCAMAFEAVWERAIPHEKYRPE